MCGCQLLSLKSAARIEQESSKNQARVLDDCGMLAEASILKTDSLGWHAHLITCPSFWAVKLQVWEEARTSSALVNVSVWSRAGHNCLQEGLHTLLSRLGRWWWMAWMKLRSLYTFLPVDSLTQPHSECVCGETMCVIEGCPRPLRPRTLSSEISTSRHLRSSL